MSFKLVCDRCKVEREFEYFPNPIKRVQITGEDANGGTRSVDYIGRWDLCQSCRNQLREYLESFIELHHGELGQLILDLAKHAGDCLAERIDPTDSDSVMKLASKVKKVLLATGLPAIAFDPQDDHTPQGVIHP